MRPLLHARLPLRGSGASVFWTAILVVAIVVFLAAAFALGSILLTYHEGQKSYDDVADKAFLSDSALSDASSVSLADLTVDWDALLAINPDTVGSSTSSRART